MRGMIQRAHKDKGGHFDPAYLGGGKMLKATVEVSLWLNV